MISRPGSYGGKEAHVDDVDDVDVDDVDVDAADDDDDDDDDDDAAAGGGGGGGGHHRRDHGDCGEYVAIDFFASGSLRILPR